MKRVWETVILVIAVLMAITCAIVVFKLLCIISPAKDFWDVATALGTVAAVVAAVWIATRDGRRRSKEALDIAAVTAAALTWRLTSASIEIDPLLRRFRFMATSGANPESFAIAYDKLSAVDVGTLDDVKGMIPLPKECAHKLAGAQDRLKGLLSLLKKISLSGDILGDPHERRRQAQQCANLFDELSQLVEFVQQECEAASHRAITSGWPFRT